MKTAFALLAASLALLPLVGSAQGSLNDARTAVRKGTNEGIVLIPARKMPEPAPVAASSAATAGGAAPAAAAAPTTPTAKPSFFGGLMDNLRLANPPSGKSLQAAKNDDSPARGIPVPSAASRPASAPR